MRLKALLKGLTPPLLLALARRSAPGKRDHLDIYWDPGMAQLLESWGEGNAWHEIRLLLGGRQGKVLDIACGTGKVMGIVQANARLEVHGCDISDYLISKARERGLAADRLTVCDAARLPYPDRSFDYAYSIGSLEHFPEEGIDQVFRECARAVKKLSFHMIPVSRDGRDEGWITPYQGYFNNGTQWWTAKARRVFREVAVLDSIWSDERSVGKWLVCES